MKIMRMNGVLAATLLATAQADINCKANITWMLSEARSNAVAISAGDAIVIGGGIAGSDGTDRGLKLSQSLDILRNTDNTGALFVQNLTLPEARYDQTGVAIGDLILFTGGKNEKGDGTATVVGFSLADGTWRYSTFPRRTSEIYKRYAQAATAPYGHPFALWAGGFMQSSSTIGYIPSNDLFVYNAAATRGTGWYMSKLSVARTGLAATSNGRYAVFAGGVTAKNEPTNIIEYVDVEHVITNLTVSTLSTRLTEARSNMAATSVSTGDGKNYLVFAGGLFGSGNSKTASAVVDLIDVTDINNPISKAVRLNSPRAFATAGTVDDLVFVGPGTDTDGELVNEVSIYNATADTWTEVTLDFLAGGAAVGVMYPNKFVVAGGANSNLDTSVAVEILECVDDGLPANCYYGDYICEQASPDWMDSYCIFWRTGDPECYGLPGVKCSCITP